MRGRAVRLVSLIGLAFSGLVGGHAVGYAVAVPDPHHRAIFEAVTGHGYLPSISWVAVVCGLVALVMGNAAGYLGHGSGHRDWRRAATRIASMQACAFILIEVVERVASGASLGTLSPSLLLVGIAVQAVVGLVVALVLIGLGRVGSSLRAPVWLRPAAAAHDPLPRTRMLVRSSWYQTSNRVRAPPPARAA